MIRMNAVKTIAAYAVIVVIAAALAAPGAFWLCQVSGIDWLARQPFRRICDRTLLATALFGGFTPAVATGLIEMTGDKGAPGLWMTAAAVCGLVATLVLYRRNVSPADARRVPAV